MPALVSTRGSQASFVYDLVAVGSSAGGLYSLQEMIDGLPADFRCPGLVVQHLSPDFKSIIAEILGRHSVVRVQQAADREKLKPGVVYIGPPAVHLLVEDGRMCLRDSPPVKYQRPSINMMFNSVAAAYGDRTIGVVLSGSGSDGAEGLAKIKSAGGYTIAEDPATAKFNSMPKAAIATGSVDRIAPSQEMSKIVFELSQLKRSVDQIVHG